MDNMADYNNFMNIGKTLSKTAEFTWGIYFILLCSVELQSAVVTL